MNNVWIYTIKILNSGQDTLSPFHIYCVAVVPDHLDHTSVIDFYLAELKELMQGQIMEFCSKGRGLKELKPIIKDHE